ncbi:MAG: lipoyl synthase [Ilumatobacteraceae bacterium]
MDGRTLSDTLRPLRVRWLGRVPYAEALELQRGFHRGSDSHLLLVEHEHTFTYGPHANLAEHLRCTPEEVGAELIAVDRGGDITYHGPGQLTGYPILSLAAGAGPLRHVLSVEEVLINALRDLGASDPGRLRGYPGVWVDASSENPRKIAAIGVRVARKRTLHGFALNVTTDMAYMREHIVACGIPDRPVTSLAEEGLTVSMSDVVAAVSRAAEAHWGSGGVDRQDVQWRTSVTDLSLFSQGAGPGEPVRLRSRARSAGLDDGLPLEERKPDWLRPVVHHGSEVLATRKVLRDHNMVTVCEDAGCPNLSECWADGTATFMVLGDRCTRACGFCLVDTSKPDGIDADEPRRVAEAVAALGLRHAVLTMVARDDLVDGGFSHVAQCVEHIRELNPDTTIETLVSDGAGNSDAWRALFAERPDVVNHNIETVQRLQRVVRPSAGYARSLAFLAASKAEGLLTKSGLILGLGESADEITSVLADLAALEIDIVTIGQYLRPTSHHLPVARWVEPDEFAQWKQVGESMGIRHIESTPLTRSSHHAAESVTAVQLSLSRTSVDDRTTA